MRRYFGLITTFVLALVVLIALSAAGSIDLYNDEESEWLPLRSSFNAGPTGTRAFYQLLEESGHRVSRWRERFDTLQEKAPNGIFILVGPYANQRELTHDEAEAMRQWIDHGGNALIISRYPHEQLSNFAIFAQHPKNVPDGKASADQIVNAKSDELMRQPTRITRDVRGLALSGFASRISLPGQAAQEEQEPAPETDATPTASPAATPALEEESAEKEVIEAVIEAAKNELVLPAPVVHLGDDQGAVLADYDYGKGRIVVLTDPFVIANNGIGRGANLQLTLNLLRELGAAERPILFDEYHHGYRSETNALIGYFRGTPFWWVLGQILLVMGLVIYGKGKRFARPLPLPQTDRHSPLEFVGSMASLQQAAEAHDLALENIYPKFKARLCRRLGLSVRAQADEIAEAVRFSPRFAPYADRLVNLIQISEQALKGATLSDAQLVELVRTLRTLNAEMK